MDRPTKEMWVAALRSGKYKQGRGVLRNASNNFCCLGVLCDIIDPEGWSHTVIGRGFRFSSHDSYSTAFLPLCLNKPLGLSTETNSKLMDMNDNGKPFSEIANYIEQNL